jgi:hypothetical protein
VHRLLSSKLGRFLLVALCTASAGVHLPGQGAQQGARPPEPPTTEVKLIPSPKTPASKAARYRGQVDALGMAFVVPNNMIFGRSALLVEGDPGKQLIIQVKNELSLQWDRELTTDTNGRAELRFRTEGKAYILIRAASGTAPYVATFFVHDELPVHKRFTKPFVTQEEYARRVAAGTAIPHTVEPEQAPVRNALNAPIGGGAAPRQQPPPVQTQPASVQQPPAAAQASGTPVVLWVIAGLLAILVGFAGVYLFKGKKSS